MRDLDRREFLAGVAGGVAAAAAPAGATTRARGALHDDRSRVRQRSRRARVPAAADRGHPPGGLAGAAAADPGRRPHRPPRRVLAGRRAEPVVRRHGRGLGARALLARRRDPARVHPRRRAAQGADRPVRRPHRHSPARGRLVRALPRGRRHEAVRPVGDPPREQGARAVPRGDGRRPRARGRRAEPPGAPRRPRPHAALRVGPLPLVRGARVGLLRLRAHARAVAPRPRAQAARAGRRLRGPLPDRRRHGADAAARPLEVDEARREHRDGHQGGRPVVAARPAPGRPGLRHADARDPRPPPRAGHRCLLRRRVPGRPEPPAGDGAVRGRRAPVLARAPLLRLRRPVLRRPARARGLQRPAGHVRPRHVVAPVRPAGQPGAVHGEPRAPLHDQRPGVEPLRPRAELRLLHREHAPGLAEARRAPLDEDAGRGAGGRGLGAVRGRASPRTACRSPCGSTPTTPSARRSRSRSAPSGPCASRSSCACRRGRRARR